MEAEVTLESAETPGSGDRASGGTDGTCHSREDPV